MKKVSCYFCFLLPVALLCAVCYSCSEEEAIIAGEPTRSGEPLSELLSIEDARMFFDELREGFAAGPFAGNRISRSGLGINPGMPEPDWERAVYSEFLGGQIIEVPIPDLVFSFLSAEHNETMEPNTVARLMVSLDEVGEIVYRTVYLMPSVRWLASKEIELMSVKVSDTGCDYSGKVLICSVYGAVMQGYGFYEGEIEEFHLPAAAATRASTCQVYGYDVYMCQTYDGVTPIPGTCVYLGPIDIGVCTPEVDEKTARAKSVFKAHDFNDSRWQKLGQSLDEMRKSCIGGKLYSEFKSKLGSGNKLDFYYDPSRGNGGSFNPSIPAIAMGRFRHSDDLLFHELFHYLQYKRGGDFTFKNLNIEIEAHIAQYLHYIKSYNSTDDESEAYKFFSNYTDGRIIKRFVDKFLCNDGTLQDTSPAGIAKFNEEFARLGRQMQTVYKNGVDNPGRYHDYVFDPNRTGAESLDTLQKIAKGC